MTNLLDGLIKNASNLISSVFPQRPASIQYVSPQNRQTIQQPYTPHAQPQLTPKQMLASLNPSFYSGIIDGLSDFEINGKLQTELRFKEREQEKIRQNKIAEQQRQNRKNTANSIPAIRNSDIASLNYLKNIENAKNAGYQMGQVKFS